MRMFSLSCISQAVLTGNTDLCSEVCGPGGQTPRLKARFAIYGIMTWASHLTSLHPSFPIGEVGVIKATMPGDYYEH